MFEESASALPFFSTKSCENNDYKFQKQYDSWNSCKTSHSLSFFLKKITISFLNILYRQNEEELFSIRDKG